ncbi:hypothetical protein F5Y06DRAFT_186804 [Hypoxylon sp. FL0890]|nr:hypothetical protein F5Y06DRAFT_186804 [Hypoxylon sp. FL0890]
MGEQPDNVNRGKPGRPRKGVASGGRKGGRPRKYPRVEDVQPRERLRAPKVPIDPGTSDRSTRLSTGNLKLPNYTLRKTRAKRRRKEVEDDDDDDDDDEDDNNVEEVRPPRKIRRKQHRTVDESDDDPFASSDEMSVRSPTDRPARREVEHRHYHVIPDDSDDYYDDDDDDDDGGRGVHDGDLGLNDDLGDIYNASPVAASPNGGGIAGDEADPGKTKQSRTSSQTATATELKPSEEEVARVLQRTPESLIPKGEYLTGVRALYWSEKNERDYQELCGAPLERWLHTKPDDGEAEMSLWRTMLVRFNATPPLLFTYGLMPSSNQYLSEESLFLKISFCRPLEQICTHPIWKKDLFRLRYVLQAAVSVGFRDHVQPIGPIPESAGFFFHGLDDPAIGSVIRKLERSVSEDEKKESNGFITFALRDIDLERLIKALDEAWSPPNYYTVMRSVEGYHQDFHSYYGEVLPRLQPQDLGQLRSFKWRYRLSEMRDFEIRLAIERANIPGEFLLDEPHPGEPAAVAIPFYEHHRDLDERAGVLLRGEYITLKRGRGQSDSRHKAWYDDDTMEPFAATVKRLDEAAARSPAASSNMETTHPEPLTTTAQSNLTQASLATTGSTGASSSTQPASATAVLPQKAADLSDAEEYLDGPLSFMSQNDDLCQNASNGLKLSLPEIQNQAAPFLQRAVDNGSFPLMERQSEILHSLRAKDACKHLLDQAKGRKREAR